MCKQNWTPAEIVEKVRLGMTRSEIKRILGEPHGVSIGSRKYPRPCIWKYNEVELHFDYPESGGLYLVGLYEDPDNHVTLLKL